MNDSIFWALLETLGHDRAIIEARAMGHNDDAFFSSEVIPGGIRVNFQKDNREIYSVDFIATTTEPAKAEPEHTAVRFTKPYANLYNRFLCAGMPAHGVVVAASMAHRYNIVGNVRKLPDDLWECIVEIHDHSFGHGERFVLRLNSAGSMVYSSLLD
jgi:hypothetical protein